MSSIPGSRLIDESLKLLDPDTYTADEVGAILDVGSATMTAEFMVDVSALTVADHSYVARLEGSNESDFGSGVVELASRALAATGRHVAGWNNVGPDGVRLRYVRLTLDVTGSTPSIAVSAAYLIPIR